MVRWCSHRFTDPDILGVKNKERFEWLIGVLFCLLQVCRKTALRAKKVSALC
jgi:hypothetical protein